MMTAAFPLMVTNERHCEPLELRGKGAAIQLNNVYAHAYAATYAGKAFTSVHHLFNWIATPIPLALHRLAMTDTIPQGSLWKNIVFHSLTDRYSSQLIESIVSQIRFAWMLIWQSSSPSFSKGWFLRYP